MRDRREQPSLEDVIEAYIASSPGPNKDSLAKCIGSYPQYARELVDFAAHWSLIKWLPRHEGSTEEEEEMLLHGISAVQSILHRQQAERDNATQEVPIIGLMEESKTKGMARAQFAEETELSVSLLYGLDRGLFDFDTIHNRVIEKIAQALDRSFTTIASYLHRGATFAIAHRKSDKVPRLAEKQDFFEAVRTDTTLKEEWRQKWLALASERMRPRDR